jgi:hypothetical protein
MSRIAAGKPVFLPAHAGGARVPAGPCVFTSAFTTCWGGVGWTVDTKPHRAGCRCRYPYNRRDNPKRDVLYVGHRHRKAAFRCTLRSMPRSHRRRRDRAESPRTCRPNVVECDHCFHRTSCRYHAKALSGHALGGASSKNRSIHPRAHYCGFKSLAISSERLREPVL